jgi:hypothetical protein
MSLCTGPQVRQSSQKKCKACKRIGHDRPAEPLHHFAEVVGARDILVQKPSGDLVGAVLLVRPQVQQHIVCPDVAGESPEEEHGPQQELGTRQPRPRVGSIVRYPPRLQIRIEHVEAKPYDHHGHRHGLPVRSHAKRIYERPVDVVQLMQPGNKQQATSVPKAFLFGIEPLIQATQTLPSRLGKKKPSDHVMQE